MCRWPCLLVLVLVGCQGASPARSRAPLDLLLASANRRAGLAPGAARAIATRARLAALLPELRAGISRTMGHDQSLSQWDAGERLGASADERLGFELRAVWRLDRLIAHPLELSALREAGRQSRAQRELELEVVRSWVDAVRARRRALRAHEAGTSAEELDELELEALAAAARLAALTGAAPVDGSWPGPETRAPERTEVP